MSFTTGGGGGAPQNSLQFAVQSSGLTLTRTPQDLPALSFTLATPGVYLVRCTADIVLQTGDEGSTIVAQLLVGGNAQPNNAILSGPNAVAHVTVAQQWKVTATAGTVVKMQAAKTSGTGASSVTTHSTLSALWVSP